MELFLDDGKLVTEKLWKERILELRVKARQPEADEKKAIAHLKPALVEAVKRRIPGQRFGVLLSGGVDSSLIALICKQLDADFVCISVGVPGSKDLEWSERFATLIETKSFQYKYDLRDVHDFIRKTVNITKRRDVVTAGVGSVLYAGCRVAEKMGITTLMSGLGSEEIFAGYERHDKAQDITDECWNGLDGMYDRDIIRDSRISSKLKITLRTPFLDPDLIAAAMNIDPALKIRNDIKKWILRQTAAELGMPTELAFRKKLAAQYGSGFHATLKRLAKIAGHKYINDYLAEI